MSTGKLILDTPPPGRWIERALCRGLDTNRWFPTGHDTGAVPICQVCPVRAECREYGVRHAAWLDGIWGGWAKERRQAELRRRQRKAS